MKRIEIGVNDAGQRVDKFLFKFLCDMPKGLMFRYLRTGHIKLNRKKPAPGDKLCVGDVLELYIGDEFFKSEDIKIRRGKLNIVYEDENILAVEKPANLSCQPDRSGKDSLVDYIKAYLIDTGAYDPSREQSFSPAVLNRLDVNTRGLVIASKNALASRTVSEWIREGYVRKFYRCIVNGVPKKERDALIGYLVKDEKKNKSRIYDYKCPGGRYVETRYEVTETRNGRSLVDIELVTGRPHQIRAHMAHIGCPLSGDFKYGGGRGTQSLCAYKLQFICENGPLSYLFNKTIEIDPKISL